MTIRQWYDSIGKKGSIFDVEDPKKFKEAVVSILCSVLHINSSDKIDELKEFCALVKGSVKPNGKNSDIDKHIYEKVKVIKEQLKNDKYKMLEFMKMLNRFIIVDECKEEDYCIFEKVKKILFD